MSRFLPPSARIDRCANSYSLCLGRTLVLSCVLLSAVDADAKGVKDLRVVIPDCVGQASWGGSIIARSMRRVMSPEVSQVIGHDEFRKTLKGLSTTQEALKGRNLLVAGCRELRADYVLHTTVTRRGWLYIARARLFDCETGKQSMDFRSEYYKPKEETKDRGRRIAVRTAQKLEVLLKEKAAQTLVTSTPSKPKAPPATAEKPTEKPIEKAATETSESEKTSSSEVKPETAVATAETPSSPGGEEAYEIPDFSADFANESFDDGVTEEFDGIEDEGGWTWSNRGWIGVSYRSFLHPDLKEEIDPHFAKLGFRPTLTGKLGPSSRLRILPLFEIDLLDERLHRVVLEEGFFEFNFDWLEMRFGWDSLTWGSASTVNVVDVINARDMSEGLIDSPKVGQPMASLKYLFGNHSFALMYLTPFIPPGFPAPGSPFSPFGDTTSRVAIDGTVQTLPELGSRVVYGADQDQWAPQAAARLALALGSIDFRASGFHGYSRFPLVHLPTNTVFYPIVQSVSTDGQILLGNTAVKFELSSLWHSETDRSRKPPITLSNGQKAAAFELPGQRFSWSVGIEHTFEGLIGKTVITPVVEILGDSDSAWFTDERPPDNLLRFFDNHLVAAISWSLENDYSSEILLIDLVDLRDAETHAFIFEYSQRLFEHFSLAIGGQWIFASEGNKFNAFKAISGIYTELQLNY